MQRKRVGQRISQARIKMGLSTQDLADRVGKSQATISRIENGKQGVSIELISQIAHVLRVHPFSLLTEQSASCQTSMLAGGVARIEESMSLLCHMLQTGRTRAHLNLESAAAALAMPINTLAAYEAGSKMPTQKELLRIADLYTLDAQHLEQVYRLEQDWPELAVRMRFLESTLADCYRVLVRSDGHASEEVRSLRQKLHSFFESEQVVSERLGGYFSIGHISDILLEALQDTAFHEKMEVLAREWKEENGSVDSPPSQEQGVQERVPVFRFGAE